LAMLIPRISVPRIGLYTTHYTETE
jgi:hypothetical protein